MSGFGGNWGLFGGNGSTGFGNMMPAMQYNSPSNMGYTPSWTGNMQGALNAGGQGGGGLGGLWNSIGGMQGVGQGIGAFGSLMNIYSGFKSMGLAEDQFDFQKDAFNKNFNMQRDLINNEYKDQYRANQLSAQDRGRTMEAESSWLEKRKV